MRRTEKKMNREDRMGPAPTEGWLGEGKSSKTWRGPIHSEEISRTERDLQEIKGWEHGQCFPCSRGLWWVCWDPGPKPQSSGTLLCHKVLSLSPLFMAFSSHEGFGPKFPQGTLPVRKIEGLSLLSPTKAFLAFFSFFFFHHGSVLLCCYFMFIFIFYNFIL